MSKKLDRILVVDVESTCWERPSPEGQENEIIEIGICLLDPANGERSGQESILVRPERSTVSAYCTQLTTLTQEQVARGTLFAEACETLQSKFLSKNRVWASYGDYDRRQFERQCASRKVPYPFGSSHINVKSLFALASGLSREVGLSEAMAKLGLPFEGTHHRGADDAWNVAAILWRIIQGARQGVTS